MNEIWMKTHLVSDNICSIVIFDVQIILQGMTNSVRLAFSVGDTTRAVYNYNWERQKELVTLFSEVLDWCET